MTSSDSPIVFIVDDDARMRPAMQRQLKTVGLHFRRAAAYQRDGGWLAVTGGIDKSHDQWN
jgi:FixJ family two-component response regulator